jgi:hypothetical protein
MNRGKLRIDDVDLGLTEDEINCIFSGSQRLPSELEESLQNKWQTLSLSEPLETTIRNLREIYKAV